MDAALPVVKKTVINQNMARVVKLRGLYTVWRCFSKVQFDDIKVCTLEGDFALPLLVIFLIVKATIWCCGTWGPFHITTVVSLTKIHSTPALPSSWISVLIPGC
jgi:hypothetical protein